MAYTSCAAGLGANIARDCAKPSNPGFTGEGLLIDLDAVTPTITQLTANPRVLTSVSVGAGDKVCVVDNVWINPFDGSANALNTENGRPKYDKTVIVRVPANTAAAAKDIIEPMAQRRLLGIFKMNDGRYLVYGFAGTMKASEQTQNEGENGGDWAVTLTSSEDWAVCELISDSSVQSTADIYDALKAKAY